MYVLSAMKMKYVTEVFLIAQSKLNALSFFKKQKNALIRGAFTRIGILLPSRLTSYKFGRSL